jgi:hypothetical protein
MRYYYESLGPEERRQSLENERRALEQRLKEVEAGMAEMK